jgi:type IV secretory pathway protease TraF
MRAWSSWVLGGVAVSVGCATLLALVQRWWPGHPMLRLNTSPSIARGLYLQTAVRAVERGMLVLIQLEPTLEDLLLERGYLAARMPLTKRVQGLPGDVVCVSETQVRATDSQGRPIPTWIGCHTLGCDEYFVGSDEHPQALGSAYFGPIRRRQILGAMRQVWRW